MSDHITVATHEFMLNEKPEKSSLILTVSNYRWLKKQEGNQDRLVCEPEHLDVILRVISSAFDKTYCRPSEVGSSLLTDGHCFLLKLFEFVELLNKSTFVWDFMSKVNFKLEKETGVQLNGNVLNQEEADQLFRNTQVTDEELVRLGDQLEQAQHEPVPIQTREASDELMELQEN